MARASSSILLAIIGTFSLALIAVSAAGKSEGLAFPGATMLLSKCLAPFNSVFSSITKTLPPVCSIEEFSTYTAADLMKLDSKQIGSLPPSYFGSLRNEQVAHLEAAFINRLGKGQALAFTKEAQAALPGNSCKVLNKIKNKPGPVTRAVIMILSAGVAFIIFKYS